MTLVANYYTDKYGFPPILVKVGDIQLDILPFTLGFFEAMLFNEIECEREFNGYMATCAHMARRLVHKMSGVELTDDDLKHIENELYLTIMKRACNGVEAIA